MNKWMSKRKMAGVEFLTQQEKMQMAKDLFQMWDS